MIDTLYRIDDVLRMRRIVSFISSVVSSLSMLGPSRTDFSTARLVAIVIEAISRLFVNWPSCTCIWFNMYRWF